MAITPFILLVILALLFSVVAIAWPKPFVLPVAVLLLCVAMLIGNK